MNGSTPVTLDDYLSGNRTTFFDASVPGSRSFYSSASQVPVAVLTIADNGTAAYTNIDGEPIDTSALTSADRAADCWMPALGRKLDGTVAPLTGAYLSSRREGGMGPTAWA